MPQQYIPPSTTIRTEILGRWHGEGTSNRLPAIDGSAINYGYVSDLYIEDGDYFRISNVTLGYDFTRLFKSKYISQLRLYASVPKISSPSPTTRAWTPKSAMEAATIGPRVSTSVTIPEPAPICLVSTSNSNSNFKTRLICKKNQRYEKDIVFYNRCHGCSPVVKIFSTRATKPKKTRATSRKPKPMSRNC